MKRSVFVGSATLIVALALVWAIPAMAQQKPVLYATNVEALYAAVNNPANAAVTVVLASGIYTLTTKDPNNQFRPNGGRLVLQPGMALIGQNRYVDFDGDGVWDPRDDNHDGFPDTDTVRGLIFSDPATETIVDGVNISGMPGAIPGAIRVGLDNRVERLTVRNTNNINAGIDVNVLPDIGGMRAEIRDCILEDGRRGIRLDISRANGVDSSAVLERNILRRNTGGFGFGLQIAIEITSNSSWDVVARNNLLYSNRVGLFVVGEGTTNVNSHVLSMRNVYRQNEVGLTMHAGRDGFPGQPLGGNGSSVHFTSVDDAILDNVGMLALGLGGGVVALGGLITNAGATLSSNDALDLQFLGTRWAGNFQGTLRRDLQVYGSLALQGLPGTNDTARVLIRQATSDGAPGAFQFIDSQPVDTTNTNTVTIIGSNIAFIHTNVGIDPPPVDWDDVQRSSVRNLGREK